MERSLYSGRYCFIENLHRRYIKSLSSLYAKAIMNLTVMKAGTSAASSMKLLLVAVQFLATLITFDCSTFEICRSKAMLYI